MINGLLSGGLWRRRAKGSTLALTMTENSVRYVLATESSERGATIAAWGTELRGNQVRDGSARRGKTRLPSAERVIVVLDSRDYQILQVESPNVPPDELRSAVRWRAMEFVEGSPHDYTIDVLPVPREPGRAENVIAIVAHNDVVRARMLDSTRLGCPASIIDVAETAQRNLLHAVLLSESVLAGVAAALVVDGGRALLIVAVKGQLYFFRRFEFDTDILAVAVDEAQSALIGTSAGTDAVSSALIQLHRSLDLWDDSYPNLPLDTLRIHTGANTGAIIDRLKLETGVETSPLMLSNIFKSNSDNKLPPWLDTAYLPLLGALLRPAAVPS